MATAFGSCTRTVGQGIPRANYDVHRPSAGSTWWFARIRFGRRSPWVDGVGVAGMTKARCGTVVLGLAVPLVAAVGVRRSSRRRFPSAQLLVAAPARSGRRCGGVGAAPARRLLGLGVVGSVGTLCGRRRGPERRAGEAKKKKELAHDVWSGARACCGNRSGLLELLASVRREQGYGGVHERTKLVLDACSVERQKLEIERESPGASLGGHGLLARLLKFLGKRNGQEN